METVLIEAATAKKELQEQQKQHYLLGQACNRCQQHLLVYSYAVLVFERRNGNRTCNAFTDTVIHVGVSASTDAL